MAAHPHQFTAEEQQKLDEKAVENQVEDDSRVTSMKQTRFRNEKVQQTFHQIQVAEDQRVQDNGIVRTTKQDGDEDSF